MSHRDKVKAALDAIDEVFSDTSVSQQETLDSLSELAEDIEMRIGAIEYDLAESTQ